MYRARSLRVVRPCPVSGLETAARLARLRRRPSNRMTARTAHFVEPFRISFVSKLPSCSVSAVLRPKWGAAERCACGSAPPLAGGQEPCAARPLRRIVGSNRMECNEVPEVVLMFSR
jgi:hypothetical protein